MLDDEQRHDVEAVEAFAGFESAAASEPGRLWRSPQLRPGIVVHEPGYEIDALLAEFALTLRSRGFRVTGLVQTNNRGGAGTGAGCADEIEFFDLAASKRGAASRASLMPGCARRSASTPILSCSAGFLSGWTRSMALRRRCGSKPDARCRCCRRFPAAASPNGSNGPRRPARCWRPIPTRCGRGGGRRISTRDLAAGVVDGEVRRIVCGARWVLVEGPHGTGPRPAARGEEPCPPRVRMGGARLLREFGAGDSILGPASKPRSGSPPSTLTTTAATWTQRPATACAGSRAAKVALS